MIAQWLMVCPIENVASFIKSVGLRVEPRTLRPELRLAEPVNDYLIVGAPLPTGAWYSYAYGTVVLIFCLCICMIGSQMFAKTSTVILGVSGLIHTVT